MSAMIDGVSFVAIFRREKEKIHAAIVVLSAELSVYVQ